MNASLPVPRSPVTCQTSTMVACPAGNSMVRPSAVPSGAAPGRAVGLLDGTVAAEPGGMAAAAGEAPRAGDAIAAVHRDRARVIARAPGQHRARGAEDLARGLRREIGRGHGAAGGLAEAPRRARVVPGDLLDDLDEREGIHLAPVEEAGQEQPEERGVEERPLHRLGEPALLLGPLAQVLEERGQRAGPLERARASRASPS